MWLSARDRRQLRQSPLPDLSGRQGFCLAGSPDRTAIAGATFYVDVYGARGPTGRASRQPKSGLWCALRCLRRGHQSARKRHPPPRRQWLWLLRRFAHLGAAAAVSPAYSLRHPGRCHRRRFRPLEPLQKRLLPAGARPVQALSRQVFSPDEGQ